MSDHWRNITGKHCWSCHTFYNCSSVNEINKITKEGLILWNKPTSSANLTQTERKYQENNII